MSFYRFDFILHRENFASINVFYGELRYSLIKDLVAYDGASFFSKYPQLNICYYAYLYTFYNILLSII